MSRERGVVPARQRRGWPTAPSFVPLRSNKRFRLTCLTWRAVLRTRCYTAEWQEYTFYPRSLILVRRPDVGYYSDWRDAKSRGSVSFLAAFLILVSAAYVWVNWSSDHRSKAILIGAAGIVSGFLLIRLVVAWRRAA